jgi:hypothetical protein
MKAIYDLSTRGSFTGVKQPVNEVDHSPPFGVEVKNV